MFQLECFAGFGDFLISKTRATLDRLVRVFSPLCESRGVRGRRFPFFRHLRVIEG